MEVRKYAVLLCIVLGNEKLWIPSKLIKIRFDQGRSPEDLGCRHEEKTYKTDDLLWDNAPVHCKDLSLVLVCKMLIGQ